MCYRMLTRVFLASLLLSLFVADGEAQELAGSFEQLRVLVKKGDTVSVVDRAGKEVPRPYLRLVLLLARDRGGRKPTDLPRE